MLTRTYGELKPKGGQVQCQLDNKTIYNVFNLDQLISYPPELKKGHNYNALNTNLVFVTPLNYTITLGACTS